MAKSTSKSVSATLDTATPKKSVVRFDGSDNEDVLTTLYVSKTAIEKLGNPDGIKVTIEAA
jgi:hypothetical protein